MPNTGGSFDPGQLRVATPEQVDLRFPMAGVGSRFIAIVLDSLLQVAAYLLLVLLAYLTTHDTALERSVDRVAGTGQKWLAAGFILLNFVFFWGYYVLFEAYWKGQTPGKRAMKLRVLKASGRSITLFEAMARNLIRVIDLLPGFYAAGLIAMLCNARHQRLGDLAADTIVVHEREAEQPGFGHTSRTLTGPLALATFDGLTPSARGEWQSSDLSLPADAVSRLTPADLHLIETFFSRALDLTVEKREELGARLAGTVTGKMGVALPAGMKPERLLELVAFRMRGQGR